MPDAARELPTYRLNLTAKEADKGRRIFERLNDWLATEGRFVVVPQDVLDHMGGLLAECYRAKREAEGDA